MGNQGAISLQAIKIIKLAKHFNGNARCQLFCPYDSTYREETTFYIHRHEPKPN